MGQTIQSGRSEPSLFQAIEFEEKFGFSNIAGRYNFPDQAGWTREDLQQRIWEQLDTPEFGAHEEIYFVENPLRPQLLAKQVDAYLESRGLARADMSEEDLLAHAESINEFMNARKHSAFIEILEKLRPLNPEAVAALDYDSEDTMEVFDVVHGMVSGFNVDDINYYLAEKRSPLSLKEQESTTEGAKRKRLQQQIEDMLGTSLEWRASCDTLNKIWDQAKDHPRQAPQEEVKVKEIGRDSKLTSIISRFRRRE